MTYHHLCPVRWSDLDAQGHVNNVIYVDYLQDARVGFFRTGSVSDLLDTGVVVVSHSLEYVAPIEYVEGPVGVELSLAKVGAAKFEVAYVLTQQGALKARARSVLCPFDFDTQSPRRLTPDERAFFTSHLQASDEFRDVPLTRLDGRGFPTETLVRWSDLDSYGHVNNVKFFDYVMQARIDMTTAIDPTMARTGAGSGATHTWLVARQDLTYLQQLDHRLVPYTVLTAPARLGRTSVTIAAEITDGVQVYARAATILVCADVAGRPIELPDDTRSRLTARLVA